MCWQAACDQSSVSIDGAEKLECVWLKFTSAGNCLQMQLLHAENRTMTMCLSTFAKNLYVPMYYYTETQKHVQYNLKFSILDVHPAVITNCFCLL